MRISPLSKGIFLMIVSWSVFAVMNSIAKHACKQLPFTITLFFQNSIALLILSPLFFFSDFSFFNTKNTKLLLARALFGLSIFVCLFFSLSLIPLTDALLLGNTGPLFLPLILQVWLKQKTSLRIWLSITIGFIGVLSIIQPSAQILHFGAFFGLLSGCLTGIVMMIVRQLVPEDPRRIILSYLLIATLCALPLALPVMHTISWEVLPSLLWVGALFAMGQWTYTKALSYADAAVLSPFSYVFVMVAVYIDWMVWERTPTKGTLLGIFLIISGGILTVLWSKETSTQHES